MEIPFSEAFNELLKIPDYCTGQRVAIAKVTTADGRTAIIRLDITTDDDDIDNSTIWVPPNAEITGSAPLRSPS